MEIFNDETQKNEKYSSSDENKSFFPRSELNDWLPLWEKVVFFLFGLFGLRIIATIVQLVVVVTPLVIINDGVMKLTDFGSAFVNFLIYLLVAGGFLALVFFDKRKTYQRLFKDFTKVDTYIYAAIGFGLVFASQSILGNLFNLIPWYGTNANQEAVNDIALRQPVLMFITTVFLAPFVEELTYRVGVLDTLGHKYQFRWLGIVISALIFGLIHIDVLTPWSNLLGAISGGMEDVSIFRYQLYTELLSLIIYVTSGLALGFTYAKSGKIASSMTAHMMVNILSMISIFLNAALNANAEFRFLG